MSLRRNMKKSVALRLEEILDSARKSGLFEFHQAGSHDQKSHGNWADGLGDVPATSSISPKDSSGVVQDVGAINGVEKVGKVGIEDWQRNHGISRSVMESRGYAHYDRTTETEDGKMDPAIKAAYGSDNSAMTQMRNAASQSSGLIMTRNAIPGTPIEKEILPQTRPDIPIISSGNLTKLRALARQQGLVSADASDKELFAALDADPELKDKVVNGFTTDVDIVENGKVTYPAGSKVPGFGAKYLFPAGDENAGRVDLVPHKENVANFMEGKGRVYIAMEGSLKTDSVLTELESSGRLAAGDSVIGVPSVTLWQNPEMKWAAREFLQGREVVLIPDADGVTNPAVINQARALQSLIEGSGAGKVIVAAPPLRNGDEIQHVSLPSGGEEKLKGVDDFLGAGRGSLDGLEYVDRAVRVPSFTSDQDMMTLAIEKGGVSKTNTLKSLENTLKAVSLVAGPNGSVKLGVRAIAAATGVSPNTALNMMERLESMGLVKSERLDQMGDSRIQELVNNGVLPRKKDSSGNWVLASTPESITTSDGVPVVKKISQHITINGRQFELTPELQSPVYTIVNEQHRAVDSPVSFLGDRRPGGPRIVRTAAGADFYGQPIGSVIQADDYKEGVE